MTMKTGNQMTPMMKKRIHMESRDLANLCMPLSPCKLSTLIMYMYMLYAHSQRRAVDQETCMQHSIVDMRGTWSVSRHMLAARGVQPPVA
jgi:hypothetical protein